MSLGACAPVQGWGGNTWVPAGVTASLRQELEYLWAMELKVYPRTLELASPFKIAHGVRTEQPTLLVELRNNQGQTGLGEAPMTSYYGLNSATCAHTLRALAPHFRGHQALEPEELHRLLDRVAPTIHPFLRCALDVAAHDLQAQVLGTTVRGMWKQPAREVPTCYTLGIGSVEESVAKIRAFPWPIYKIKMGGPDDVAVLKALRRVTDSPFYVDANTGWTADQAISLFPALKALGVVFIEQPLPVDDLEGQRRVKAASPLPLIADESCQTESDVAACAELFHGINIKVVKCGGLLPARRMIRQARERGLSVMAGCMTESSIGISGIAQLLAELDYADLDGAMLIKNDPAAGVTFDPATGYPVWPEGLGTGARLIR